MDAYYLNMIFCNSDLVLLKVVFFFFVIIYTLFLVTVITQNTGCSYLMKGSKELISVS